MRQSVRKPRRWPWIIACVVALLVGFFGGTGFMVWGAARAFSAKCPTIYEPKPGEFVFTPDSGAVRPRPLARLPEAEVPTVGRMARVNGTVQTLLYVEKDGQVSRIALGRSSGFCPYDARALRDAQQMTFSPGMWRGEPVAGWISMSITYYGGDRPVRRRPAPPARTTPT